MLHYKQSVRGITLLTTLIFLQIITLLSLYLIRMAWLEMKQAHYFWFQQNIINTAQNRLSEIEKNLKIALPNCMIEKTTSAELVGYPFEWWQSKACQGHTKKFSYYYVVESLEKDPCAIIQNANPMIANYFRITLLCKAEQSRVILQSTIVLPHQEEMLMCDGIKHSVNLGRQMWRELY